MKVIVKNKEIELEIANNFFKRLKGFMFNKNITYCLRFKTNSIHTFFMRQNIDLVMTDKNNKVLYLIKDLSKNKIVIHQNVYYSYEFPSGFIDNLNIGDILIVKDWSF